MTTSPYMCCKIVQSQDTSCEMKADNQKYHGWQICGMDADAPIHQQLTDGHHFNLEALYHKTHTMTLHPIDGVFCTTCDGYSYDQVPVLESPCVN